MTRWILAAALSGVVVTACQTTPEAEPVDAAAVAAQPAPPPPSAAAIPAGTELTLQLATALSSEHSKVGDIFTATVVNALTATNNEVVIPSGAVVTGMVTGVDDSDHIGDQAAIRLNFLRIDINGATHPLSADIAAANVVTKSDVDASDRARAATVGAAAGAVLGAIIGGDLRDALIGAALGAGAGTIISLGAGETEAVLPAGTNLLVRTRDRIELR